MFVITSYSIHYTKLYEIENYILKPINIDELESTIRHIRGDWEREELNLFRYEEDWRVLRSNILQRWVLGEIEGQEFKHRAELLGIPLDYKYVQALVFRVISVITSYSIHYTKLYERRATRCG